MLGTHDLPLFIASGLLLNVTPGADTVYIASRSMSQGVRAGMAAALGIGLGCWVHILAAALGLSAILAASALAFGLVKLVGAAYLVYLGLSMWRARAPADAGVVTAARAPMRKVFLQGFLTNALNPKVALFFLAFMPQFIESTAAHKPLAFVFLGAIFDFNATLWCLFLAWATASARSIGIGRRTRAWLSRSVGALFILLGLRLALAERG
ncbi:MAG: LysE family translocator [Burkholderiales bacterium]|nr:LysE family translocator [Burkholderiales bacterium]MDE1927276.1 LysE family translocator [Burkholderiales bacterium]MDE2158214.1 LysE family translocator [Burkholderiales bacterium]MDE2505523.1 LysE family translocator [Burkholderiales bacterium]